MNKEEKIKHFKMAASFCNFGFNEEQIDMLVSLYELVSEKGGQTTIEDLVNTRHEVCQRFLKKALEEKQKQYDALNK